MRWRNRPARDYPKGSCGYRVVLAHEQEHVRRNLQVLRAAEPLYRRSLEGVLRRWRAGVPVPVATARERLKEEVGAVLYPVDEEVRELGARLHGAIDTPEAYRRTWAPCAKERG